MLIWECTGDSFIISFSLYHKYTNHTQLIHDVYSLRDRLAVSPKKTSKLSLCGDLQNGVIARYWDRGRREFTDLELIAQWSHLGEATYIVYFYLPSLIPLSVIILRFVRETTAYISGVLQHVVLNQLWNRRCCLHWICSLASIWAYAAR